jgi:hypothetical protein
METSKHTPGPFTAVEYSTGMHKYIPHVDISGKDGQHVATVALCFPGYSGTDELLAERQANAALIAAAPELLEALKAVRDIVDADAARLVASVGNGPEADNRLSAATSYIEQVDDAIAKAEGRS